jgi:undecaprenyl-diphosphatase
VGLFVVALILTLSIGASRAYIGVHFPSDVAAGLAFGWGWALLVSAVFSYLTAKAEQLRQSD